MISLRAKLTLTLLFMSFIVIGVVGLTARWIVQVRFDELVTGRVLDTFISDITRYYEFHGSWEAAREGISFAEFNARRQAVRGPETGTGSTGQDPGLHANVIPATPPANMQTRRPSPVPFLVIDRSGTVLIDLAGYSAGDVIPFESLDYIRPIQSDDMEIGFAVALERPELTALERRYLSSIELSWLYSLLISMILAIPVGIVLGNVLSAPIKDLRKAIRAMEGGALRQLVKVRSHDEIGELSNAFNQMSKNLAEAHDELEASRKKLTEQAEELKELSRRDELTRLLNRRAFDDLAITLFAQAIRFNHPITLAMADIDHFKNVNDEFSHATGDVVLHEVARLINDNLREIDLLARYGGEEFAITFPQTDIHGARIFANRLREIVAAHDWSSIETGLSITLSIGLAERISETSFRDVLNRADEKLYEAKTGGRNQVCS